MKPYTGPADETCPYRLGELCSTACPSCKFQQPFEVPGADGIKWECCLMMQHILTIENTRAVNATGKEIAAFKSETVEQNRALINGTVKVAQHVLEGSARQVLIGQDG